jgi:hypothetical protein
MFTLAAVFPVIALLVDIVIMAICLREISVKTHFRYLSRNAWVFIVIFGSIFGQLLYFMMEYNKNDK